MTIIISAVFGIIFLNLVQTKVVPEIKCTPESLDVRVSKEGVQSVELEKWNSIPGCQSMTEGSSFLVRLRLTPDLPCGTTRIRNKLTDESLFYHKLAITDASGVRHLYKVSCFISRSKGLESNIVKRNVLPSGFVEPDYIEITSEVTGVAPIPELSVGVRQGGNLIGNQVTVSPGAPLSMEVYLDSESASIYGILVSYMMVTDTSDKNETIIFNGCTQDHYVFENFKTEDGDFLTAKFRAFKFPESNYLLFRGTVDVCLDKCQGIQCSNGDIGFGRRRRAVPEEADPNKIFEVTMMTFIKFEDDLNNRESIYEFGKRERVSSRSDSTMMHSDKDSAFGLSSRATQMEAEESNAIPPIVIVHRNSSSPIFISYFLVGALILIQKFLA
ncbi:UNVERIFIED_CONTAM: hypothetical protein RMT77_017042 [Armadillidium vulgare]